MVSREAPKITRMVLSFCSQLTGRFPTSTSRIVPPPIAVTKAMISVPNGSSFRSMAENVPAAAKAKVPRMSMM